MVHVLLKACIFIAIALGKNKEFGIKSKSHIFYLLYIRSPNVYVMIQFYLYKTVRKILSESQL